MYVKKAKLLSVEIDPDHQITLDRDYLNNSIATEPQRGATEKIATYWTFLDTVPGPDVELVDLTEETTMADENKGLVAAGASLVWRRQRVLWWVYAVNLVLGLLGAAGAHSQLDKLLKFSLAGEGLTKGFDFGMFLELVARPEANLLRSAGSSVLFACLFPLFMIFVTGGILEVYRQDRRFTAGDFFAASGVFFWRFVRLALFSLVPFGILFGILSGVNKLSDYLGDRATAAQTGFYHSLGGRDCRHTAFVVCQAVV